MSETHAVFTNDPVRQHAMIHRRVLVTTTDNQEYVGWVHTIDPVSESVILVEFGENGSTEVIIVSGYNVKNITVQDDKPSPSLVSAIDNLFEKNSKMQYYTTSGVHGLHKLGAAINNCGVYNFTENVTSVSRISWFLIIHYSSQELTARRESLCVWLAENRVPYTVRDDMSVEVLQTAVIAQPYEPGSVQCTNEVVLDKVMKLVQQMPVQAATTT
nr:gem-associated protein 6-like [Penaeus vannamei]